MRVAFVHSFYSSRQPSGENLVVESEVGALRRAGHEVALFAAKTDDLENSALYKSRAALRVATGLGASPIQAIRAFAPDIVHVHNLFPNYGRAWVDAVDVPLVATLHNYRPLCANGVLFRDGHVCTLCPDGASWSGVRYGCYRGSRLATLPLSFSNRAGPARDRLLARAARVIFLSDRQLEIYRRAGFGAETAVVWPNFLSRELDPGPGMTTGPPRHWLYAGRLSVEKGIRELIQSWPMAFHLKIAGDGPQMAELRAAARGKPIEFVGALPRHLVVKEMTTSVGLVFPSIAIEGFPLVYIEALACGLPSLAFGDNIVSTLTARDGTGWTARLPKELGGALSEAEQEAPTMRGLCRSVFEKKYAETAYLERATHLYESLIHH
jgi:glycosyltransferase involved in cell wall biosynthesis